MLCVSDVQADQINIRFPPAIAVFRRSQKLHGQAKTSPVTLKEARESGEWAEVLLAWDNLKNGLQPVVQGLQRVARAAGEISRALR